MFKRRIRRPGELKFPYGMSIALSCGLLVAMISTFAVFADPASGEIRPASLAWMGLAGTPAAIAVVFYAESKLRSRNSKIRQSKDGAPHKC